MFLKVGLLITLPFLVLGAVVLKDGVVVVDVVNHREDSRIFVPVPLSLVNFAAGMVPRPHRTEVAEKLKNCQPYMDAFANQMVDLPDAVFVEVRNPREQVHVAKEGNSLVIDVNNSDEKVHVSVPIRGMKRVIQNLTNVAN